MYLKGCLKLGEKQIMWLKKLQIAVLEKDIDKLQKVLNEKPQVDSKAEAQEALYLLRDALELLHKLKDETAISLKKMEKMKDFLGSTNYEDGSIRLNQVS